MKGFPNGPVPVSDENGNYSTSVPYAFSGWVVPSKPGYEFEPPTKQYVQVTENLPKEDYVARVLTFTISDRIAMDDEPLEGVTITALPGDNSVVTDANGRYSIQVPYGWTGRLTISREDMLFDPSSISYNSVTSDIIDGKTVSRSTGTATPRPRTAVPEPAGNVLVVPTKGVSPVEFTQIAEDMRVMLNILHEKLSEPRTIRGVLYDYGDFFGDAGRATEGLYFQGYAAVFLLKADFPLSLPQQQGQTESQKTEPADPVWQRARDRLYSPQSVSPYGPPGMSREADQKSLNQLKEDLVKTLKHAANIRNIDPNEWIILTVTGRSDVSFAGGFGGGMVGGMGGMMGGYGGGSGSFRMNPSAGSLPRSRSSAGRTPRAPASPASTTVMTIQAKKADIDAFSQGTLSLEQFQQKVKVFTY